MKTISHRGQDDDRHLHRHHTHRLSLMSCTFLMLTLFSCLMAMLDVTAASTSLKTRGAPVKVVQKDGYKAMAIPQILSSGEFQLPEGCISAGFYQRITEGSVDDLKDLPQELATDRIYPIGGLLRRGAPVKVVHKFRYKAMAIPEILSSGQFQLPEGCISAGFYQRMTEESVDDLKDLPQELATDRIYPIGGQPLNF